LFVGVVKKNDVVRRFSVSMFLVTPFFADAVMMILVVLFLACSLSFQFGRMMFSRAMIIGV